MRATVALPTGPFDLDESRFPQRIFDASIAALRSVMRGQGVTHTVIHGSVFDHEALTYLTYFTPKLGPAYALIPADGHPRLLFSGGPGMKPSAAKLTWIKEVVALRGIDTDLRQWLKDAAAGNPVTLGLLEGSAMSLHDWQTVRRAAGGVVIELDIHYRIPALEVELQPLSQEASSLCDKLASSFARRMKLGDDIRAEMLELERMAYRGGAQDVRVLAARRPNGQPTRLPDAPLPIAGPTPIEVALRYRGEWHTTAFTLHPSA